MIKALLFVAWTLGVGWFCYDTGFNYGEAAGIRWAHQIAFGH